MQAEGTRVAAYCRVSTEKDEQLLSLAHQKEFFEDYAQKNGLTLTRVYADEGLSGTRLKSRHAFLALMRDAEAGAFERVLVKDVSRLARNVVDFLQSVRRLRALGIDCRFITSGMSLADGELTLTILAAVAQEESANLSSRVKFGKRKNAEQGRVPNLVYGYDKLPGEYFSLAINPHEAEVVRQVFDWYASGDYGTGRIARMLTERGEHTKRGCAFTQAAVRRLLSHRLYIGEIVNGRERVADFLTGRREAQDEAAWLVRQSPALAIVPRKQFAAVQDMLAGRSQAFGQGARHRQYPLSGLIRCAACGQSFRRLTRKTKAGERISWVCGGRNLRGADFCENRTALAEDELLSGIAQHLEGFVDEALLREATRRCTRAATPAADTRRAAEQELRRIERAKTRLMALYEAEAVTLAEFRTRMDTLRAEETQAQARGGTENPAPPTPQLPLPLTAAALDSPLLHALVDRIAVTQDGTATVHMKKVV